MAFTTNTELQEATRHHTFIKGVLDIDNLNVHNVSYWTVGGTSKAGAVPTTAVTTDYTTTGAVQFNPHPTKTTYLAGMQIRSDVNNSAGNTSQPSYDVMSVILYDRLIHSANLLGNTTASQTVNTPTLPSRGQNSDSSDVEWYLEQWVYFSSGNIGTVTVTYTDGVTGVGSKTTTVPGTASAVGDMSKIWPNAGETIQSIESIACGTGNASASCRFGVLAVRKLAAISMMQGICKADGYELGFPVVHNSACLAVILVGTNAFLEPVGPVMGELLFAQG
jgi:hypothetical protein